MDIQWRLVSKANSVKLNTVAVGIPPTMYYLSTPSEQQNSLGLRKCVHTNFPGEGFKFGSLGLQAGMLPIESPLLVTTKYLIKKTKNNQFKSLLNHEGSFLGDFLGLNFSKKVLSLNILR